MPVNTTKVNYTSKNCDNSCYNNWKEDTSTNSLNNKENRNCKPNQTYNNSWIIESYQTRCSSWWSCNWSLSHISSLSAYSISTWINCKLQETCIFNTYISKENTNTCWNGRLKCCRNRFNNHLTYFSNCDNQRNNTTQKDHSQGFLPSVAQRKDHCVGKEGIETHTRRLSVR